MSTRSSNYSDRAGIRVLSKLLWASGLTVLARRMLVQSGRFALMFHGISASKHPEFPKDVQPYLCKDELQAILFWLRKRFEFLSPQEFFSSNKPGVLLTFDDGLANNYVNALPVLVEFNAPAVFFVAAQHVKNPQNWLPAEIRKATRFWGSPKRVPDAIARDFFDGMSAAQVRTCAEHPLIAIGSHSFTHPFLTSCTETQLVEEIAGSKAYLEELTGQPVDLFAYPTGDYNRSVAEKVREAGYQAAFVMEDPLGVDLPNYEIPRIGLYAADRPYLGLKLSGLYRKPL